MARLLLIALLGSVAACGGDDDGAAPAVPIADSGIAVGGSGGAWRVEADGRTLLESAPGLPAVALQVEDSAEFFFGSFYFTESETGRVEATAASVQGAEVLLDGVARVAFEPVGPGIVRGRVTGSDAEAGRPVLRFACQPGSRFAGLGAQVDGFDHRGERVPLWVAEQGNGKKVGAVREDFPATDVHDSYFPVPWVFDPAAGWGMLIEGTQRVVLDLCAADPDAWTVEVRASQWSFVLVAGDDPLALIERLTSVTGRQTLPNPWALGVWTDAVRGQDAVLHHARALREAGVPVSAIWSEDWAGHRENRLSGFGLSYHWDVDEDLYPDLPGLTSELQDMGIAFLGYFNTFMQEDSPQWDEAVAGEHVITNEAGDPYTFTAPSLRPASLVDVTRQATRDWMAAHMKRAADLGIRGWMADFAEWLPTDSSSAAGDG